MNTRNLRFRSNRVRDIMSLFHEELDGLYGSGEVGVYVDMLFEAFLGWDKVRLLTSKEQTIDQSDLLRFHWALEDLKQHRPIQHIIGYTDFCGCRIKVSPDVLIPRPETEEIVNWVITHHSSFNIYHCLDLCTGSGCIAIALKKTFPTAEVTAVDISPAALEIALENAKNNGADIRFMQTDVLNGVDGLSGSYGLIVSNPPYVMEREKGNIALHVKNHEPTSALFVPDDNALQFYYALAQWGLATLTSHGAIYCELNNLLAHDTEKVFRQQGFTQTAILCDRFNNPRFIKCRK